MVLATQPGLAVVLVEDAPTSPRGYRLVRNVDYDAVAERCSAIAPAPGGVGAMTIAMLRANTVTAAERFCSGNLAASMAGQVSSTGQHSADFHYLRTIPLRDSLDRRHSLRIEERWEWMSTVSPLGLQRL